MSRSLENKYGGFSLAGPTNKRSLDENNSPLSGNESFHCETFMITIQSQREEYVALMNDLHSRPNEIAWFDTMHSFSKEGDCTMIVQYLEKKKKKPVQKKKESYGTFSNIIQLAQKEIEMQQAEVEAEDASRD